MYNNSIFCTSLDKVPKGPHYAIVEFTSHISPGYDPGDSSYSSPSQNYIAFLNKQDWEAEIQERTLRKYNPTPFLAIHVTPADIRVNVRVEIE